MTKRRSHTTADDDSDFTEKAQLLKWSIENLIMMAKTMLPVSAQADLMRYIADTLGPKRARGKEHHEDGTGYCVCGSGSCGPK